MCGIAGLVGAFVTGLVSRMNVVQRHRGPDGKGVLRILEDLPAAIEEARRRNTQPVPPPPSRKLEFVAQAIKELLNQRK